MSIKHEHPARFDAPLTAASPTVGPESVADMAPVPPVSSKIAHLLPPVGIMREAPHAPAPEVLTTPLRPRHRSRRELPARRSSATVTLAVVATAMGVGVMAIIPALGWGENSPQSNTADSKNAPLRASRIAAVPHNEPARPPMRASAPRRVRDSATSAAQESGRDEELTAGLAEILDHLGKRNVAAASGNMRRLASLSWSEAQATRIARYAALVSANHRFWVEFEEALDAVAAGRSFHWGAQETAIVEVGDAFIIVRRGGRNARIQRDDLPGELVGALAESLLDMDDPRNQVLLGAFFFAFNGADSAEARRLWEQADAAGESVSLLMPLLAAP